GDGSSTRLPAAWPARGLGRRGAADADAGQAAGTPRLTSPAARSAGIHRPADRTALARQGAWETADRDSGICLRAPEAARVNGDRDDGGRLRPQSRGRAVGSAPLRAAAAPRARRARGR